MCDGFSFSVPLCVCGCSDVGGYQDVGGALGQVHEMRNQPRVQFLELGS
jgi:hypothetical protein